MSTKINILSTLTELTNEERMLFSMRYDNEMNKKYTLEQIADFYGYSKETARKRIILLHEKLKDLTYGMF
jgi:DNA-directed RNA polymerase sigma subunit (sigma70/sigma32)